MQVSKLTLNCRRLQQTSCNCRSSVVSSIFGVCLLFHWSREAAQVRLWRWAMALDYGADQRRLIDCAKRCWVSTLHRPISRRRSEGSSGNDSDIASRPEIRKQARPSSLNSTAQSELTQIRMDQVSIHSIKSHLECPVSVATRQLKASEHEQSSRLSTFQFDQSNLSADVSDGQKNFTRNGTNTWLKRFLRVPSFRRHR